jgi:putative hydrolase
MGCRNSGNYTIITVVGFLDDDEDPELLNFLHQIVGDSADDVLAQMRARGMDPRQMLSLDGKLPNPATITAAMEQVRRIMTAAGDNPVNTVIAHDMARQASVTGGDPSITGTKAEEVASAFRAGDLWLDVATDFAPPKQKPKAWSRAEWVEATLPAWNRMVAPVASAMSEALEKVLGGQFEPSEFADDDEPVRFGALGEDALDRLGLGGLEPSALLRRLGATSYGMQIGHAAGRLSREVFGATDLGIPLLAEPGAAMLPANVAAFADDLDIPITEVQSYLAVREAAAARLFYQVPWLKSYVTGLIEQYAAQTEIDLHSLEEQMRDVDPSSPAQIGEAMSGGIFAPRNTPEQKATLLRLETVLALIEGWIEEVTTQATIAHLPHSMALKEMMRRRRGAGGPAEQAFATLVGLELRPRRARDAAKLFGHVYVAGGVAGRDAVWEHPDLLPEPLDLDDPAGYLARREAQTIETADLDAALAEILGGGGV